MDAPCHQAVLERRLGVKFPHEEDAHHEQQQGNGDAGEARRLAICCLLVGFDDPGTFLLHGGWYSISGLWGEGKLRLRSSSDGDKRTAGPWVIWRFAIFGATRPLRL